MVEDMSGLKLMIFGFIFLLVGVVFIASLADEVTRVTQANTVPNESITLVNASSVSLANSQLDSFTSLINATNATDELTVNTDFTVDLNGGSITGIDKSGDFNATYVYREVGDSTSRTLVNLVILFFALGIMIAGAAMAMKGLRDAGVIDR